MKISLSNYAIKVKLILKGLAGFWLRKNASVMFVESLPMQQKNKLDCDVQSCLPLGVVVTIFVRRPFAFAVFFFLAVCSAKKSFAEDFFLAQEHQQASHAVLRTVIGILSFVRWPEPRKELNLCVIGEVRFAASLNGELQQSNGTLLRMQRYQDSNLLPLDCNVIYLGKLSTTAQQRLFGRFYYSSIVLISEADKNCTSGSMFCLTVANRKVAFAVNLDSVSRSQVRVHPTVLKLARHKS